MVTVRAVKDAGIEEGTQVLRAEIGEHRIQRIEDPSQAGPPSRTLGRTFQNQAELVRWITLRIRLRVESTSITRIGYSLLHVAINSSCPTSF